MTTTYFFILLFVFVFWFKVSVFLRGKVEIDSFRGVLAVLVPDLIFASLGTYFFHCIW